MKIKLKYLLVLINLIIIVPIIFLSFFSEPASDDFAYGASSVLLNGTFWDVQISLYEEWSSRYFATTFLILSPLAFKTLDYFFIYPLLFILLYFLSFNYFLKSLRVKQYFLISSSFLSVFILLQTSLVENFYWLAGSVTYFLPCIFYVFLLGSLININNQFSVKSLLLAILSLIVLGGCSEITLGYSFITIFMFFAYDYFFQKKIHKVYLLLLLFTLVFMFLVVLSPGNLNREETINEGLTLFEILLLTFKKVIVITVRYLIFGFVFFSVINLIIKPKIFLNNQLTIFTLLVGLMVFLFLGSFISVYTLKANFPVRVENLLVFISLLFLYFISYLFVNKNYINAKTIYSAGIILFIIYIVLPKNEYQKLNNLSLVYSDIFSGEVFRYHKEINDRYILLENCSGDCVVPKLENRPMSIVYKDLSSDPTHFYNSSVATYYKLKSVKVK